MDTPVDLIDLVRAGYPEGCRLMMEETQTRPDHVERGGIHLLNDSEWRTAHYMAEALQSFHAFARQNPNCMETGCFQILAALGDDRSLQLLQEAATSDDHPERAAARNVLNSCRARQPAARASKMLRTHQTSDNRANV